MGLNRPELESPRARPADTLWTSDDGAEQTLDHEDKYMATDLVTHESANPLALLQDALERGTDPDKLGRLMDLAERWEDRRAEQEYAAAMQACQAEMKPVIRDTLNKQTGSHYAKAETIHKELKGIWIKHGFTLSYGSDVSPYPDHYRCTCVCRHVGGHSTTHFLDAPSDEKGMKGNASKTPIQGVLSTMSYLRRNLACLIFDITIADMDQDGNRHDGPTISLDQLATLNDWLINKDVNLDRFLKWAEVDSLDKMPASKFQAAIDFLKRK